MAADLTPFVNRLQIVTKKLEVLRLGDVMNYAQYQVVDEFNKAIEERRRCRIITLKARQIGISTVTEGLMFTLSMILQRMSGLVVSHEASSARHLLRMTSHYWDTWRFKHLYSIRHNSVNHMSWLETGSQIQIATAKNIGAGHSQTIQFLHGSEVSRWDKAENLMTGLAPSIPTGFPSFIVLESTANGIGGYFHEQWNAAVEGESEFKPMFFPWHKHPEHTAAHLGLGVSLGALNDEERVLKAIGISDDRLVWRRWALKNICGGDIQHLHEQFPTVPEEAFVVTGHNIFPDGDLTSCYEPMHGLNGYLVEEGGRVRFQESLDGPVTIFRFPGEDMEKCKYMISGDATRSIHGDYSCAQVLNRRSWEQVAIFRKRVDPLAFGDQMTLLGRYYNWAILCPEIQGAGDSTIARIISLNYPFVFEHRKAERIPGQPETVYGWWSGVRAKQEAMGNLLHAIVDHDIIIHDHKTYEELRAYVSDGKGGFKNGTDEKHDDTVTALAIAMTCVMYEAPNINASLGVYGVSRLQDQASTINRALEMAGLGSELGPRTPEDGGVSRDSVVLPWELGDPDERMRNIREQQGEYA